MPVPGIYSEFEGQIRWSEWFALFATFDLGQGKSGGRFTADGHDRCDFLVVKSISDWGSCSFSGSRSEAKLRLLVDDDGTSAATVLRARVCVARAYAQGSYTRIDFVLCSPGVAPDGCSSSTQPNHWIVKMLIKKKVVNDYFAARRGRHPHSAKPASAVAADKPSKVKRGSKTVSSMGANGIPRSSALPIDSRVPPITGE